jgi:ribosomal protein S4E
MATNPENKTQTIAYKGGTVTGARGLLEWILPPIALSWTPQGVTNNNRKRKYGTIQRSSARAGKVHFLETQDGQKFSVRVTGPTVKFLDIIIANASDSKIKAVYTQSGTKYAPQFPVAGAI